MLADMWGVPSNGMLLCQNEKGFPSYVELHTPAVVYGNQMSQC